MKANGSGVVSAAVAGTDFQAPYANLTNIGSITNSAGYLKNVGNGTFTYVGSITDTDLSTITTAGKVSNTATTATSANTANAIVARDASGNFTAGTITGTLSGTATNVSGIVAIANGGTGSSTQNFVDLSTTQTIAGAKTLSGITTVSNATGSTSTTTGALIVSGGAGIAGAVYAGSIQNTPVGSTTASTGSFTTLVASGNSTLTSLTATGAATFSSTVKITTDAAAGKVLTSDASGNATWQTGVTTLSTKTASYTLTLNDNFIIMGTSASTGLTFTLPTAVGCSGKEFTIKNLSAYSVSIATTSSEFIIQDNSTATTTSATIGIEPSNNWIKVISDGTNWIAFRALF
jgi:hypothetical protein